MDRTNRPTINDLADLVKPAEAEAMLGVTRRTLMRYEKAGRITAVRLPSGHRRFTRAAVLALTERAIA